MQACAPEDRESQQAEQKTKLPYAFCHGMACRSIAAEPDYTSDQAQEETQIEEKGVFICPGKPDPVSEKIRVGWQAAFIAFQQVMQGADQELVKENTKAARPKNEAREGPHLASAQGLQNFSPPSGGLLGSVKKQQHLTTEQSHPEIRHILNDSTTDSRKHKRQV
ncbi:hypothetical protein E3E11_08390 [Oecophyllibacter saccharovorans]|uniref:hypothetical protein n=1 Tax=Oecophyllibacter saccharovorans TaxID=2558360 RepID=UPI001144E29C|nr:hypothetical protein [Oecophyllibacter saccharovorans]QDH15867.1 hypothetical protein E3E11_08390 [Oecophyllibacter saccharovorans]